MNRPEKLNTQDIRLLLNAATIKRTKIRPFFRFQQNLAHGTSNKLVGKSQKITFLESYCGGIPTIPQILETLNMAEEIMGCFSRISHEEIYIPPVA